IATRCARREVVSFAFAKVPSRPAFIDNISGLLWHGKSSWCRHCFGLQIEGETRVDTPHTLTIQRWDLVPFYFDEHPLFQETRKGTTCSAFELLRINRSFVVRIGRLEAFLDDRKKLVFV